jgi:hypothetical protein
MRRLLLSSVLAILVCAQIPAYAAGTAKNGDELKTKLESYETKINQAFKDKDSAAFMAHVDANAWQADASGFAPVTDVPTMMKDTEIQNFTISDYRIHMVDPEACVATYVWKGTGTYKGQAFPVAPVYCSTVWTKKGDDWKAVYHQETISMEGMAPAASTSR